MRSGFVVDRSANLAGDADGSPEQFLAQSGASLRLVFAGTYELRPDGDDVVGDDHDVIRFEAVSDGDARRHAGTILQSRAASERLRAS